MQTDYGKGFGSKDYLKDKSSIGISFTSFGDKEIEE